MTPMKTVSSLVLVLLTGTLSALAASGWQTDFTAAQTAAKKDGRAILLDFTGSDWCGWCIKMKKDSLDQKAFQEFADKKLMLVEVDFPNNKKQTDEVKKQNEGLQKSTAWTGIRPSSWWIRAARSSAAMSVISRAGLRPSFRRSKNGPRPVPRRSNGFY